VPSTSAFLVNILICSCYKFKIKGTVLLNEYQMYGKFKTSLRTKVGAPGTVPRKVCEIMIRDVRYGLT
jgi:hypothetical protein